MKQNKYVRFALGEEQHKKLKRKAERSGMPVANLCKLIVCTVLNDEQNININFAEDKTARVRGAV